MFENAHNVDIHGGTFTMNFGDGQRSVTKVNPDGKVSTTLYTRQHWTTGASQSCTPAGPSLYDSYDPCSGAYQQAPPWTSPANAFSAQAPTNDVRIYGDGSNGRRSGVDEKTIKSKNPFQRYSDVDSSRPRSPPPTFEEAFGDDEPESPVDQQGASSNDAAGHNQDFTKSRFTFEDAYGPGVSDSEVPLHQQWSSSSSTAPSVPTDRWENTGTNFPPDRAGWEGPSRTSVKVLGSNGRLLYSGSVPPGSEFDPLTVQGGNWTSEERRHFSQIMHNAREVTQRANEVSEMAIAVSERAMAIHGHWH
ncbi:hypothetical protein CC1G_01496 [Coprinopsis cinerea okayama7|uniref:Uncharacterized protein n=1 Tax=Coprinopsis cinerea (strain Okayama-7 / 130 / ATCC MYA-4618 / FGSC 9003) TaxID=240176 RepID=A8NHS9_COPC7|nr:hypothetical protein CC1G_01496 [Coprinopsis cinerea okayama7\|eukprot:XP_001833819.2 hypothetical protein CC1G_01496 [Coprinopsis cinerea okayama7\